jgi:hypothetical protein
VALPMPAAPPVIIATFPFSRILSSPDYIEFEAVYSIYRMRSVNE